MPRTGYSIAAVRLWLDVEEIGIIDISQVSFTYALNSIPQAQMVLAAGVRPRTGKASLAFELAEEADVFMKAKLWLKGEQGAVSEKGVPKVNGKYLLFEGYITGIHGSLGGGVRLSAAMTHWLTDLNFSSAISASSSPENPYQFTFNAAVPGDEDVGGAGAHFLPTTKAQALIAADGGAAVKADLWGQGILPWFQSLAASDRINLPEFGRNDTPDEQVKKALERFDGDKLPLQIDGLDYQSAAAAIAHDISATTLDPNSTSNHLLGMSNVTLWDKLVGELAPLFRFAVVPFPTKAKVVPFTSGLRTVWKPLGSVSISNRDTTGLDLDSRLQRLLGGTGIYSSLNSAAGGLAPEHAPPPGLHIGGKFIGDDKGMILLKRAPRWMDQVILPQGKPEGPINVTIADGMVPAAGAAPTGKRPKEKMVEAKTLFDKLAQSLYIDEVLRHRTGQIVTPLRFDICPGSTISFQGHNTGKDAVRYAGVLAVSYSIDAEQSSAQTIFTVSHVRTDKQNKDDKTSIARHPLYDRVWVGDHLMEKE